MIGLGGRCMGVDLFFVLEHGLAMGDTHLDVWLLTTVVGVVMGFGHYDRGGGWVVIGGHYGN